MSDFLASFDWMLLPRDETILVACSGGGDSLALLLALYEAEYTVVAGHVNHGTRGVENQADEEFVRTICEKRGIPFSCVRLSLGETNPNEATLREARYAALQQMAREYSCARIATGHSADDVLETILLNWLRGATVAGFSGIPSQRALAAGVLLVRPMLGVTREEVRSWLRKKNVEWRDDSSNENPQFLRNRVRHDLLPLLAEIGGGSTRRLARQSARSASIWQSDVEFLESSAQVALDALQIRHDENLLILEGLKFRELAIAMQRRVLRLSARSLNPSARDLEFERIEEVRRHVMENRKRAVWQWKSDLRVEWTGEYAGNRLRFMRV